MKLADASVFLDGKPVVGLANIEIPTLAEIPSAPRLPPYARIPADELVGSFAPDSRASQMRTRNMFAWVDASLVSNGRDVGSASCVGFANDAVAAGIVFA